MTLLKTEGFDAYTTLSQRWNAQSSGGVSVTAGVPRTGRGCWSATTGGIRNTFGSGDAHATYIVGAANWREGAPGTAQGIISLWGDAGITQHITLLIDAVGGATVRRGSSSGAILGTIAAGTFPLDAYYYVELKALISDTVGTIEVRKDGNPTALLALTAQDTKNGGTNVSFDAVQFTMGGSGSPNVRWDDVYICNGAGSVNNDFLGDTEIVTLLPTADGPVVQFTPSTGSSHFALVNEVVPSSGNFNSGLTDGNRDLYEFADLTNTGGLIRGITRLPFIAKTGTEAKFFRDVLRIAGVDYEAASIALGTGFIYVPRVRETSPATSTAFTAAEINAMYAGAVAKDS